MIRAISRKILLEIAVQNGLKLRGHLTDLSWIPLLSDTPFGQLPTRNSPEKIGRIAQICQELSAGESRSVWLTQRQRKTGVLKF